MQYVLGRSPGELLNAVPRVSVTLVLEIEVIGSQSQAVMGKETAQAATSKRELLSLKLQSGSHFDWFLVTRYHAPDQRGK